MSKPRIGLVGCGYWGRNIARNLHDLGVLAAVCDSNQAARDGFARSYGVPGFATMEQMLSNGDVDAVAIATPSETHGRLAALALRADRDVFVEKPMATKVREGVELVEVAREHGRVLMVGHLLEYHGAVLRLKELVDSGELGKIEYAYSNRLNMGRVRREENALWSFAPHDVAVLLLLLGELPIQVTATGGSYLQPNIADVTVSNLLFDGGIRAHIFVSWLHPFKEQKLVISGTKRMALFNDVLSKDKLVLFDRNIEQVEGELVAHRVEGTAVAYNKTEPLKEELTQFVTCMRTREQPRTDGLSGLRVLSVLQASQRSIQTNGEPIILRPSLQEVIFA